MLNGLDLFSGIGGLTLALQGYVNPIAYCEIDPYAQAVLISRMSSGQLPIAPIWDDITTLKGDLLSRKPEIIYGGFPCQDISIANSKGKGLEGSRSGLFFEIMRLVDETSPVFLFLENVPNIVNRGLDEILTQISKRGYDCRWRILSAADVGAPHVRKRWWLLAYSRSFHGRLPSFNNIRQEPQESEVSDIASLCSNISDSYSVRRNGRVGDRKRRQVYDSREDIEKDNQEWNKRNTRVREIRSVFPYPESKGREGQRKVSFRKSSKQSFYCSRRWWKTEPNVGRVVDGIPYRVDRIKCLGNAVVPLQAKEAFETLMGIK